MNKSMILCSALSVLGLYAKGFQESAGENEFVILRNAHVLSKTTVDDINVQLGYVQWYHATLYDALCLAIIMDTAKTVCSNNTSLLQQLNLVDEANRLKDDVATVLDARLMDHNSIHPSPYQSSCEPQGRPISEDLEH